MESGIWLYDEDGGDGSDVFIHFGRWRHVTYLGTRDCVFITPPCSNIRFSVSLIITTSMGYT